MWNGALGISVLIQFGGFELDRGTSFWDLRWEGRLGFTVVGNFWGFGGFTCQFFLI